MERQARESTRPLRQASETSAQWHNKQLADHATMRAESRDGGCAGRRRHRWHLAVHVSSVAASGAAAIFLRVLLGHSVNFFQLMPLALSILDRC